MYVEYSIFKVFTDVLYTHTYCHTIHFSTNRHTGLFFHKRTSREMFETYHTYISNIQGIYRYGSNIQGIYRYGKHAYIPPHDSFSQSLTHRIIFPKTNITRYVRNIYETHICLIFKIFINVIYMDTHIHTATQFIYPRTNIQDYFSTKEQHEVC